MAFGTTTTIPQYKVPTTNVLKQGPRSNLIMSGKGFFSGIARKLGAGLFSGNQGMSKLRRNRKGAN